MWMIVVAGVAVAGLYLWYATLISRRNKVREALSSVDVHLNQRLHGIRLTISTS